MTTIHVCVRRIQHITAEVRMLELEPLNGATLSPFTPGAHIDVYLGPGLVRQYSLCNGPTDTAFYTIAVKREAQSRGGSVQLHERVREGDTLEIGTPRNNFELRETAGHYVLVAGGIGVTPILSMARHLLHRGASFELHYFARSIPLAAFHDELSTSAFAGRVDFHYALEPEATRSKLRKILCVE